MKGSLLIKVAFALLLILVLCEFIEAAAVPKRRNQRKRMPHEPYDPNNVDPEDPYDEEEERPPMPPGMMEHSATPKLVKGINLKGDSTPIDTSLIPLVFPLILRHYIGFPLLTLSLYDNS